MAKTKPTKTPISNKEFIVMFIPVILALIIAAFAMGMYAAQSRQLAVQQNQPAAEVPTIDTTNPAPTTEIPGGEITVDWAQGAATPDAKSFKEVTPNAAFMKGMQAFEKQSDPGFNFLVGQAGKINNAASLRAFELGKVAGGKYDGYTLQLVAKYYSAMTDEVNYYYLLVPENSNTKPVLLTAYYDYYNRSFAPIGDGLDGVALQPSDMGYWDFASIFGDSINLDQSIILGLQSNPTIDLGSNGSLSLVAVGGFITQLADTFNATYLASSDKSYTGIGGQTVYLRSLKDSVEDGLYYYVRQDGRVVWYQTNLDGWTTGDMGHQTLTIKQTNGKTFTGDYIKFISGGCGVMRYVNITNMPQIAGAAVQLGAYTVDGKSHDVYIPTVAGRAKFADIQTEWLAWNEGKSADDFWAQNPYLFVKNTAGQWVQLQNVIALPAAECGKPVIYLYPEKTTDLSVHVAPVGGFTKTEPAYGEGWNVTAQPNGQLTNKADGKAYPYLFWEGRGGLYSFPEKYYVIAQKDLDSKLPAILAQIGLNKNETADFMEYWRPKMTSKAFYKVGFHGTNIMNILAPLTVSQKPDTLLRVLMDYQGLDAAVPANEPKLPVTPARKGFTVIEWGGVLGR